MLELIAALAMQETAVPDGLRAECVLNVQTRRDRLRSIAAACPEDAPDADRLQDYADRLVARIELPTAAPPGSWIKSRIELVWSGGQWALPEPVILLRTPPHFPPSAARRGIQATCSGIALFDGAGRPYEVDVHCRRAGPEGLGEPTTLFVEAVTEAVNAHRWLVPLRAERGCDRVNMTFQLAGQAETPEEISVPEVPTCPNRAADPTSSRDMPLQADCRLLVHAQDRESRVPERFEAVCPADVPESDALQAAADAALGAVDLALDLPDGAGVETAPAIGYRFEPGEGWQPEAGQVVIRVIPRFPARAVARGARHMLCAAALRPDAAGVPRSPDVACLSNVGAHNPLLEREMRAAAQSMRLLPVGYGYCLDDQSYVSASVVGESRTASMPDPARLPNLCEAEDA
ncbi:hypothetical protein E5163_07375 [Marinicauda algicola]|uniref:Uncharacterized protein n=1 Tax=Marinicauda algicola TaxID=2029849 RepID=A0A4S2H0E0_9PROT|nr:hypothetical protein [Marinicauda algicola]TGY88946.1 hypothetical protein E5163_07375 [Marinicauda algicola]